MVPLHAKSGDIDHRTTPHIGHIRPVRFGECQWRSIQRITFLKSTVVEGSIGISGPTAVRDFVSSAMSQTIDRAYVIVKLGIIATPINAPAKTKAEVNALISIGFTNPGVSNLSSSHDSWPWHRLRVCSRSSAPRESFRGRIRFAGTRSRSFLFFRPRTSPDERTMHAGGGFQIGHALNTSGSHRGCCPRRS
jgi:hypothetical protein